MSDRGASDFSTHLHGGATLAVLAFVSLDAWGNPNGIITGISSSPWLAKYGLIAAMIASIIYLRMMLREGIDLLVHRRHRPRILVRAARYDRVSAALVIELSCGVAVTCPSKDIPALRDVALDDSEVIEISRGRRLHFPRHRITLDAARTSACCSIMCEPVRAVSDSGRLWHRHVVVGQAFSLTRGPRVPIFTA